MQRPFTSGSRQAPDPFDQFLEENNFYRKHTARDSSCLFRTISEQMYDTQLHHLDIRKKCVTYMREHYSYFKKQVDRDLDEYLDDMSKPKTYGTLVELQAAALLFKRNVFLFEPYTLGNYFVFRSHFNRVFRLFYTPERHFDSVFTSDYIKDVAICQSICYEILYKDMFKLPDVTFAVEQMLHSSSLETTPYRSECNEDGYCTQICMEDGRKFDFDLPENTNCILENYQLCHFHNEEFPRFSEELQRDLKNAKKDDAEYKFLSKTVDSLLPDKFISCVRQLLLEGITPFPYKVAKALDPNMYRNIEFDSWNEARKELKLQNWYNGDSNFKLMKYEKRRLRRILQVGAKCHVKLCKSENDLYTCHIQEMSVEKGYCIVFVEQLGEKRLVPYDSLKPLPPDQFKPWSLPYRLQRHIQKCNTYRYARQFNYRFKVDEQFTTEYCLPELKSVGDYDDDPKQQNCIYNLKQFTHLENFRTHTMEYCTMPLTVEHNRDNVADNKSQRNDSSRATSRCSELPKVEYDADNTTQPEPAPGEMEMSVESGPCIYHPSSVYPEEYYTYGFDPSVIQPMIPGGAPPVYYMCNGSGYAQTGGMYMQAPPPTPVIAASTQNPGSFYPQYYSVPATTGGGNYNITPSISRRGQSDTTPLNGRINLDVKKSTKTNGIDLPNDIATLRYFFNLGVEYHQKVNKTPNTDLMIDSKEGIVKTTPIDNQALKLDENGNEIKTEMNSNVPTTESNASTSNNTNNYSNNKANNSQRRFSSRYFNNKERTNYRSGQQQNNRYHQNDQHKGQKSNTNHQVQYAGQNATPNSRNGPPTGNVQQPGGVNPLSGPELGMQNSPMNPENNGDMGQTPTTYTSNGQFVAPYVQDYDQPPPQASGVYMPVPVSPASYGIYAAPPSIGGGPVAMHSTPGFPYMTAPPPPAVPLPSPVQTGPPQAQMTPTYYPPPASESGAAMIDGSMDPNQYPCIGYPPPMHFYYSPSGILVPPPLQGMTVVTSINQQPTNRRDQPPKHRHPSTGEQ